MEKKRNNKTINLGTLIPVVGFNVILPILAGSISIISFFILLIFTISTYIISAKFTTKLNTNYQSLTRLLPIIGCYVIPILIFPLLCVQSVSLGLVVTAFMVICAVAIDFKTSQFTFTFNRDIVLISAVSLIVLLVFYRLPEALSATPLMYSSYFQDVYWFTANTASLTDGSFNTSLYEEGTGVYHHILGLFPAAVISRLTGVSTHTALWSIATPFGIFCSVTSLMALLSILKSVKVNLTYLGVGLCAILFTFPINPNYLLAGRFTEMVWFGPGQTLPVLPTWVSIYVFSSLFIILLVHVRDTLNWKILLLSLMLSIGIGWGKITSYAMFLGAVMLFLIIYERKLFTKKQIVTLIGLLPVAVLILTFYSNSSAKFVVAPGYIVEHFGGSTYSGLSSLIKPLVMASLALVVWLNIRSMMFLGLRNKLVRSISLTTILSLGVCIAILSILRIKSFNSVGEFMIDTSFDLLQFTRSTFIYITIAYGVFYVLLSYDELYVKSWVKKTTTILIVLWAAIVVCLSIPAQVAMHKSVIERPWDKEVVNELKRYPGEKKAMTSSIEYSGQFVTAHDIGPFYTCLKDREGGYTYAYDFIDRYERLNTFLEEQGPKTYIEELKRNQVKILVANPQNITNFIALTDEGLLKRVDNTKWLFTYD